MNPGAPDPEAVFTTVIGVGFYCFEVEQVFTGHDPKLPGPKLPPVVLEPAAEKSAGVETRRLLKLALTG